MRVSQENGAYNAAGFQAGFLVIEVFPQVVDQSPDFGAFPQHSSHEFLLRSGRCHALSRCEVLCTGVM